MTGTKWIQAAGLTTEFKSLMYQGSECQLNQNLSRQIKGPADVSLLLPKALFHYFLPGPSGGSGHGGEVQRHLGASIPAPLSPQSQPLPLHWEHRRVSWGIGLAGGWGMKRSKTNWLIASPAMMSAWINVSHRHANQLHDIIAASITPVGHQSYSKDNITQHLKPQETSTTLLDVL